MHQLSAVGGDAAVYVADVGQHQMWAAQSLQLRADQRFLTSGGLGSMGFGLPAAIGAAFGVAGRPVVLVAGDGGFQTNIQELQTVARNQLPLKMLIVEQPDPRHGPPVPAELLRQPVPVHGLGLQRAGLRRGGRRLRDPVERGRDTGRRRGGRVVADVRAGPALLEVMVSPETNAYPKLAFGRPITEMEPFATPVGMEGT